MSKAIKTKDAKKGGYLVGKPHSEGGIKGINTDTGQPIEVEGGEVVITKPAVEGQETYEFEGKEMKPKEILSKINSDYGGVSFAKGGQMLENKFEDGGVLQATFETPDMQRNYTLIRGNCVIVDAYGVDNRDIESVSNIRFSKSQPIIEIATSKGWSPIQQTMCVGDWVYMSGGFYTGLNQKLWVTENLDAGNLFPLKAWQVKNISLDNNYKLTGIHFIREVNGLIQKVKMLNINEQNVWELVAIAFATIQNIGAILPDNFRQTDEIIYPENNGSGLSDAWMYGRFGLSVAYNQIVQRAINFKYDVNNLVTYCSIIGYSNMELNTGRNELTSLDLSDLSLKQRYHTIGDVVDVLVYKNEITRVVSIQEDDFSLFDVTYNSTPVDMSAIGYSMSDKDYMILDKCTIVGMTFKSGIVSFVNNEYKFKQPFIRDVIISHNNQLYAITESSKIGRVYELAQPSQFGITTSTLATPVSDFEKEKKQVRSKPTTENFSYKVLAQTLENEITQLNLWRGVVQDKKRQNEIDRKLANLRTQRDLYQLKAEAVTSLLDKLAAVNSQEKISNEAADTELLAPNGTPTMLTNQQWHTVRTENFMSWFGDWLMAYETGNYGGVSKTINPTTQEPLVLFHGSAGDFIRWKFDQFPAAYFADNFSYSQWFANQAQGGSGVLYQVFVDIKNPLDLRSFGYDNYPIRTYLEYLRDTYNIAFEEGTPIYKQYEAGGDDILNQFLDTPVPFWSFIRHINQDLLTYLRDNTFYDGIIMYEHNPSDLINGEPNVTGSYVVFRSEQIKWASASHYNAYVKDSRFRLGGITENTDEITNAVQRLNELDFGF